MALIMAASAAEAKKLGRARGPASVAPTDGLAKAPPKAMRDPKNLALLEGNLKKVESSIKLTRNKIRNAREIEFVPDLQFMLAELLLEKSKIMYTIKKEKNPDAPEAEIDFSAAKVAMGEGIDQLRLVDDRYPTFNLRDKVIFTLGLELKRMRDTDKALASFKKLVDTYPQSPYAVRGMIEIGNIYFEKKDFEFAYEQYQKALKVPESSYAPMAAYKAGWCEVYRGNFLSAMLNYEKVLQSPYAVGQYEDPEKRKSDLREDALVASAWPYSELTQKEFSAYPRFIEPLSYYKSISPDKVHYRRALRRLAQRLDLKKMYKEALNVSRELFLLEDDLAESTDSMEQFYSFQLKTKVDSVSRDVVEKVAAALWLLKEKKMAKQLDKYELLFRDMLTRAHKYGLSIKRVEDLEAVVAGYNQYLEIYPNSKNKAEMQINLAEAEFVAKGFTDAGLEYWRAAHLSKNHPKYQAKTKEFMDSSLQAYTTSLSMADDLGYVDKAVARSGYRKVLDEYVNLYPSDRNLPLLRFNYAKSLYDEQKYLEAADAFDMLIKKHPQSPHAQKGAILLLDCFYLQDQLKELVRRGNALMNASALPSDTKSKIAAVIQQAQLKSVKSVAGEFASSKYANKFLELAKRNPSSAVSEPALYEAYLSFKAAGDLKQYEVGEQYATQFSSSPRAKEVLNQIIQTALITMDLERASNYMLAFVQQYPSDPASGTYKGQAALLLEQTGQVKEAIKYNLDQKNSLKAAQLAANFGDWGQLAQISSGISGNEGLYYQGLALYRQGQKEHGLELLGRAFAGRTGDKENVAHAGVILAENKIQDFSALGQGEFSAAALQKLIAAYQEINKSLQEVLLQGSGRWSMGALALSGQINQKFAQVLKNSSPPKGMAPAAFSTMIAPQIANYQKTAQEYYGKCVEFVDKEEILTEYARMCKSQGQTLAKEIDEKKTLPQGRKMSVELKSGAATALLKNPRSVPLLREVFSHNIQMKNYLGAYAVANRMVEIEPKSAQAWADVGVASLYISDLDTALSAFKKSREADPNNGTALRGMVGLFRKFGLQTQMAKIEAQARRAPAAVGPAHPLVTGEGRE